MNCSHAQSIGLGARCTLMQMSALRGALLGTLGPPFWHSDTLSARSAGYPVGCWLGSEKDDCALEP
jgi:hypothetical protein